jgi:homoserine kinase
MVSTAATSVVSSASPETAGTGHSPYLHPARPRPLARPDRCSASPFPTLPALPGLPGAGEQVSFVRLRVPLSIANVGPGFDHFGLCLEGPADVLELRRARAAALEVYGDGGVPRDLKRNVATVAAQELFRLAGEPYRVEARLWKGYHGGSGIGSSGASAVAGALGAASLLALDGSKSETLSWVLQAARKGERVASGSDHVDNAAASLFGGFTLVEAADELRIHRIVPPEGLRIVVALPDLRVETRKARAVLPPEVPRGDAVNNASRAGALVLGLLRGDLPLVGRSLVDRLAEPYREVLVPGLPEARTHGLAAGAWGVALAGSGPAVFALAPDELGTEVAAALANGFAEKNIRADTFISRVGEGAELVGWG